MCLSFVHREKDAIIAMNFDNNGMKYSVNTKNPKLFIVLVDGGRGSSPSFGVNSDGVFINNLVVDSNGKGLYRRPSKKVTHTSKLVKDILDEMIEPENIGEYLNNIEVVNTPDRSTHNMICDSQSNVWIVEPGRGNIYSPAASTSYYVMSNFSLWDYHNEGSVCECTRYKAVSDKLSKLNEINVEQAFDLLESAKQAEGEWVTALSIVYSKKINTVYYCFNGNFEERIEYKFPV